MNYANAELRALAARATPLFKRGSVGVVPEGTDYDRVEDRLQKWRYAFSLEGDPELLSRRLALDGLDLENCIRWLGPVRLADDQPLPDWAVRFNTLLQHVLNRTKCKIGHREEAFLPSEPAANFDFTMSEPVSDKPLPFGDVWIHFVACATEELRDRAGGALKNLNEDAIRCFQKQLHEALSHLAALSMGLEFRLLVAQHDSLSIFRPAAADSSPLPDELYRRFVKGLLGGGLLQFFQEYAVLARLMTTVVEYWIEHVAEFCRRLDEDRSALSALFNQDQNLGNILQVKLGLSDPHQRGRTVVIATFDCGLKIVYKPKDLGIDESYWALVDWLNTQAQGSSKRGSCESNHTGCMVPLRSIKVLNQTNYGWVEFVEHRSCQDASEAKLYYRRMGMLLYLTYVLGGTDFHLENIIACRDQPVLVDLETMLQPLQRPWDVQQTLSADGRAAEIMHDSVLRTGLLPFWTIANFGKSFDMSGIGAEDQQETGYFNPQWEDVNTDRMRVVYRSAKMQPDANRSMMDDKVVSAREHVAVMADGFAATYRVLLSRREELLAEGGPLRRFRGLKLRCVLRPTQAYAQMSRRLRHPEFLRDGADRSIELERLARAFVAIRHDPQYTPPWEVYLAELDALERLDIPFFNFISDANSLRADGRAVASGFFSEIGQVYLERRIRGLSEEDLVVQTNFIHATMYARFANTTSRAVNPVSTSEAALDARPLARAELIAAAVSIAEQVRAASIHGADGSTTWFSLQFNSMGQRLNLLPMDDNLYDGRIGVALFLAALEHVAGETGFRDLALSAMLPLRRSLQDLIPPVTRWTTLGGAMGLGGQLYALIRVADWLRDDELLQLARRVADWFIPRRIARDEALDVIGGAAGGILGLLALSAASNNGDALNAAVLCGDHLLEKRAVSDSGHRAWATSWARRPLTGFGHGAAGIAYALLRLSQATGELRFRAAAEEAIAYETSVYSIENRNWPDFRDWPAQEGTQFMLAWCAGATGIGLARLGGLSVLDSPSIRKDIAIAIQTTLASPPSEVDHLCCGNLGRIDFLLEASLRVERPDLLDEARRRAAEIVRRAVHAGRFCLHAQAPGVTDSPSFFQGTAGIGYALMRLAEPKGLPCVLLWE